MEVWHCQSKMACAGELRFVVSADAGRAAYLKFKELIVRHDQQLDALLLEECTQFMTP
jgi:hypothetical protein